MKATITDDGRLVIKAENGLESFALEKWSKENQAPFEFALSIRLIDGSKKNEKKEQKKRAKEENKNEKQ